MSGKSTAVAVTQALSADGYFPLWHKYYASQVGPENLFVVTPRDIASEFTSFQLGGVISTPTRQYDERQRVRFMASFTASLLEFYEAVIYADTDEFLVPDPRKFSSLRNFLENDRRPYLTSIGLDLVQNINEARLDNAQPIIGKQRNLVVLNSSLCKTLIVRTPIRWGVGYHFSSFYPNPSDMFLIHMKRACTEAQFAWLEKMSQFDITTEQIRAYYQPERQKLDNYVKRIQSLPIDAGWDYLPSPEFLQQYLAQIKLDLNDNIYRGTHFSWNRLARLPAEFIGIL